MLLQKEPLVGMPRCMHSAGHGSGGGGLTDATEDWRSQVMHMEKKLFNIKTVACRNEHCTKHTQHHILLKAEEDCVHQHRTAQSLEVTTRHRAGVGLTTPPSSLSLSYFLSHDRHSLISPFLLPPAPPSLPPSLSLSLSAQAALHCCEKIFN